MSVKPDFITMTTLELRSYILAHRDDDEALQIYLDKRHSENPNARVYQPDDNVAGAIATKSTSDAIFLQPSES